eukprot:1189940-Prorocentrum_minimum.AAC.3
MHPLFRSLANTQEACVQRGPVRVQSEQSCGLGYRAVMTVTLSADQRVYNGDVGAKMLAAFKANIEQPARMMMP